jgi:hypothetical protein
MQPTPPTFDQIQALLTGRARQFTHEWTGKTRLTGSEYKEVFTVTRDEVHQYVARNGIPTGAWSSRPGVSDGLYMVEKGELYAVYFQERGIAFDQTTYPTKIDAEAALTDWLLALSGTRLFTLGDATKGAARKQSTWLSRLLARLREVARCW